MVDTVYLNNAHALTGDGLFYFEGLAEERSDIASFPTDYAVGSKILCAKDWSGWILTRSGNDKVWSETSGITWSIMLR